MAGKLAAIGRQCQFVQLAAGEMPREAAHQAHDVLAHQGLSPRQPQLAHAMADEGAAQPVQFLQRQDLRLGQEDHVLGHAIDAAEIAPVRH